MGLTVHVVTETDRIPPQKGDADSYATSTGEKMNKRSSRDDDLKHVV
jgi:hypothetical protein